MLASTKTGAIMQLFPRWVAPARLYKLEGLDRKVTPHRLVVFARFAHALLEHLANQPRHAFVMPRRVHAHPGGGLFGEGNSDVFHSGDINFIRLGVITLDL